MNGLRVFRNEEFGQVRMIEIDGKPYAVGSDVARALGYAIPHKAVRDNCKGVLTWNILTNGGEQEVLIIPEGDIYRLIVKAADQSKNPEIKAKAERFEKWIFDEVIPTIRKHGAYLTPEKIEEVLLNPDTIIKLATQLKEERLKRLEAEKKVIALQPKAEMFDTFMTGKNAQTMNEVAKCLGIGRNKLFKFLRDHKILMSNNTPYECYRREGYFEVIETPIKMGDIVINKPQTLVTPKGVQFIARLLKEKRIIA